MLGAFGAARPRLTLSELSRASGLSLTTTHRIVTDLVEWGALEEADGGYQAGLRLWEAACAAPRGLALRETALPAMADLYEATHENVQLAVREGLDVVYVERITGHGDRVVVCPQDETGLLDLDRIVTGHPAGALLYSCGPAPLLDALETACATLPACTLRTGNPPTWSTRDVGEAVRPHGEGRPVYQGARYAHRMRGSVRPAPGLRRRTTRRR
ncbi:helix-turn-helix domain-containing protein [Streptomyces sp. MK37H]|uniref:helix-turn-helix domain-containing protein n=1 Tax=Streptomyces sp. MK37H TaxID=2699117 RepID=UPI001B359727|nr:helix-turn-helix domain-containing protein [Streptomyces sp. MK37H]